MKNKNPLYVVKGKDVQEANSVIDLVIKKFNLEPVMNVLKNIFYLLIEQVQSFASFQAVKNFIVETLQRIHDLGKRMGIPTA
jgi:ABC-type polar amino acid transport system ATPase subunit